MGVVQRIFVRRTLNKVGSEPTDLSPLEVGGKLDGELFLCEVPLAVGGRTDGVKPIDGHRGENLLTDTGAETY
jgi:hypothetical protein